MSAQATVQQLQAEFAAAAKRARDLSDQLAPITEEMVAAAPTWRAAYSDRTCALMASLCAIAYDDFEDLTGVGLGLMRHRLTGGQFTLVGTYNTPIGTQAYLAASDQMIVLAFRGTQDQKDWLVNLDADAAPLRQTAGSVCVHKGFLQAFQAVEPEIRRDLERWQQAAKKPVGLYITGHSLGGALAQIASAAFERDTLAACYTFGSPRVGRKGFDVEVKCPHYRMVNARDVVPSVPPPWLGFAHGGDVRVLGRDGDPPKRHDRMPILLVLRLAWYGFWWFFTRKFALIDDHMIGQYRQKLMAAANLRAPGWQTGGVAPTPPTTAQSPPPSAEAQGEFSLVFEEEEIFARLQTAYLGAVRRGGRVLSPDNVHDLRHMAQEAARRIVEETPSLEARAALTIQGELAFNRFVAEMVSIARGLENYPPDRLGEETLIQARFRLCPLPPIC